LIAKSTLARSAVGLALLMLLVTGGPATAAQVSTEEARAIGVDAYLYFYPLVTMDLTRKQLTNVEPGAGGLGGPPNTFVNIPEYRAPTSRSWSAPTSTRFIPARGSTSPRSR
jgi:hypothetical protein